MQKNCIDLFILYDQLLQLFSNLPECFIEFLFCRQKMFIQSVFRHFNLMYRKRYFILIFKQVFCFNIEMK